MSGAPTMRIDVKYEDRDTPAIQNYGRKLTAALEGGSQSEGGCK